MKRMRKKRMAALCCALLGAAALGYADAADAAVSASLDWVKMDINAKARLKLRPAGITLPSGRSLAEERLFNDYFDHVRPFLYALPVDSSSTLGDAVERGELDARMVDELALKADMTPPSISNDFQEISAAYIINLSKVSSTLITHQKSAPFALPLKPLSPPSYTGIVIIADGELPVHGKHSSAFLAPCLFPKIWDTEMNLIYDKKHTDPALFRRATMVRYLDKSHIFQRTPSSLSPEIIKITGDKPLRIIARALFGVNPTDLVIDREDALLILSSEANRRLLREGRVAIISADSALKQDL